MQKLLGLLVIMVEVFQNLMIDVVEKTCAKARPNMEKWNPKISIATTQATDEL